MYSEDKNAKYNHKMLGTQQSKATEEKDLEVVISSNLRYAKECIAGSSKANQMIGFIAQNIDKKKKKRQKHPLHSSMF